MIIDTSKMANRAKNALKTTKGKIAGGFGALAVAALIVITSFGHEGDGERSEHGKNHYADHAEMLHGDHMRSNRDNQSYDLTIAQIAGLEMSLPGSVTAAETATNGRALEAEFKANKTGQIAVDVHLMLKDESANNVVVNTSDGSLMTAELFEQMRSATGENGSDKG